MLKVKVDPLRGMPAINTIIGRAFFELTGPKSGHHVDSKPSPAAIRTSKSTSREPDLTNLVQIDLHYSIFNRDGYYFQA
jgi:hypothetical protein